MNEVYITCCLAIIAVYSWIGIILHNNFFLKRGFRGIAVPLIWPVILVCYLLVYGKNRSDIW